jgi:hypothetical protein
MTRWVGRGRRCRDCDATLVDTCLAELGGSHGAVEVLLRDYPVRACPEGHRRRQHRTQPAPIVLEAIAVAIGASGRARRRRCDCGARVAASAPEVPGRWELTVEAAETTIGVTVTGPAVRCDGCGRLVGDPRQELLVSPVPDALIDAFDRAGIAP